jgi:hypothetical protein
LSALTVTSIRGRRPAMTMANNTRKTRLIVRGFGAFCAVAGVGGTAVVSGIAVIYNGSTA